jgi:hypothetical protein
MEESHEIRYVKRTYRYDPVDRLFSSAVDRSIPEIYEYDRSGNLISRSAPHAPPPQQTSPGQTQASARHFCVQCGAVLQAGKPFCPQCGKKVG